MTRSDHRDAGTRKNLDTSTHEQHDRRIIDFLQTCWVSRIFERNNFCATVSGFGNFLLRQFNRLSCGQRLSRDDRHSCRFQFGQAGVEHSFRTTEMFHQFSYARGPQAGSQC